MTASSTRLSFQLLGRFAVNVVGNHAQSVRIGGKKSRGLLAYLAMHPEHYESRETLATLFWGNNLDKQARQNLRQCLVSLRADLSGPAPHLLQVTGETIALAADSLAVDAIEFVGLAESDATGDLDRAASLYRGEFLTDLRFAEEPFEEWARSQRVSLAAIATRVLETCTARYEGRDEGESAIAAATRLVALDPLREDWQRLLIRLYARYRSTAAAITHANELAVLLKRELDIDPEPATRALVAEIKRGATAAGSPLVALTATVSGGAAEPTRDQVVPAENAAALPVRGLPKSRVWPFRPFVVAAITGAAVLGVAVWGFPRTTVPSVQAPAQHSATEAGWMSPRLASGRAADMKALSAKAVVPLVVLPFFAHGNGQAVADALTDDLITVLSRNSGLRVISHQTSLYHRGSGADPLAIGAQLGVSYVVEGSVQTEGKAVRINIQLVDVATGLQSWSNSFLRDEGGWLTVQDEIVKRLARELKVEVFVAISRHNAHNQPRETAVVELIAKARAAQFRGPAADDVKEALRFYEEALERDPELVAAHVGVAGQLIMGSLHHLFDPETTFDRAEKLLQRALSFDPDSDAVHYWLGIAQKAQRRYDGALQSFNRAVEINPSFAPAYAHIGNALTFMGRADEALNQIQYAMRLSPKDRMMGFWTLFAGQAEMELGHREKAIEWLLRSAAHTPRDPSVHAHLAAAYALMGDRVKAAWHVAEFRRLCSATAADRLMDEIKRSPEDGGLTLSRLRAGLRLAFNSGA